MPYNGNTCGAKVIGPLDAALTWVITRIIRRFKAPTYKGQDEQLYHYCGHRSNLTLTDSGWRCEKHIDQ